MHFICRHKVWDTANWNRRGITVVSSTIKLVFVVQRTNDATAWRLKRLRRFSCYRNRSRIDRRNVTFIRNFENPFPKEIVLTQPVAISIRYPTDRHVVETGENVVGIRTVALRRGRRLKAFYPRKRFNFRGRSGPVRDRKRRMLRAKKAVVEDPGDSALSSSDTVRPETTDYSAKRSRFTGFNAY